MCLSAFEWIDDRMNLVVIIRHFQRAHQSAQHPNRIKILRQIGSQDKPDICWMGIRLSVHLIIFFCSEPQRGQGLSVMYQLAFIVVN